MTMEQYSIVRHVILLPVVLLLVVNIIAGRRSERGRSQVKRYNLFGIVDYI